MNRAIIRNTRLDHISKSDADLFCRMVKEYTMDRGTQVFGYTAPGPVTPQFVQLFQREGIGDQTLVLRDPTGFIVAMTIPVVTRIEMARALNGAQAVREMTPDQRVAYAQVLIEGTDYIITPRNPDHV